MNEVSFTIASTSHSARIIPNDIGGRCDGLNAYLNIYTGFALNPLAHKDFSFDIISILGQLYLVNPTQLLSEVFVPMAIPVRGSESKPGETLSFRLDDTTIAFIEKNRHGDIAMRLDLKIQCLIKRLVPAVAGVKFYAVDHVHIAPVKIDFLIPRSNWVEKILPSLGYRNLKLIEIPVNHETLNEAYSGILFEFDQAEKYFNSHDYNKCVAHCRNAMDNLTRNLKKIKDKVKSESGFDWLENISTETFRWLDGVNKATSAIASKAHHLGQKNDFNRYEAESIYLVVLGLLNYIGNLKNSIATKA